MASTTLAIDARALDRIMRSPDGPVVRHAMVVGEQVKDRARQRVGVSNPAQRVTRSGGAQHLRDTIVKRMVEDGRGVAVLVVAEAPHATFHHDGTDPHPIRPVRARALRFVGSRGQVVFAQHVQHPGTKANPFLVDAATDVGLNVRRT